MTDWGTLHDLPEREDMPPEIAAMGLPDDDKLRIIINTSESKPGDAYRFLRPGVIIAVLFVPFINWSEKRPLPAIGAAVAAGAAASALVFVPMADRPSAPPPVQAIERTVTMPAIPPVTVTATPARTAPPSPHRTRPTPPADSPRARVQPGDGEESPPRRVERQREPVLTRARNPQPARRPTPTRAPTRITTAPQAIQEPTRRTAGEPDRPTASTQSMDEQERPTATQPPEDPPEDQPEAEEPEEETEPPSPDPEPQQNCTIGIRLGELVKVCVGL